MAAALVVVLAVSRRNELRKWVTAVTLAACVLPLVSADTDLSPSVNRRFFDDRPAALNLLPARPVDAAGPPRIFAEPALNPSNRRPSAYMVDLAQVGFLPVSAQVDYVTRVSLQSATGVLELENSLHNDPEHVLPKPQYLLNRMVTHQGPTAEQVGNLLRLSSVEFAFLRELAAPAGFISLGVAPNGSTSPVRVYAVGGSVPRAYLVPPAGAIELPPGATTLARLLSPDFDPVTQVVLETRPPPAAMQAATRPHGSTRIVQRRPMYVEVEVTTTGPCYLVLTDSYHPDWRATVNGREAPVIRANQMFRAVAIPPGTHRVVFRYRPMSFFAGASLTGIAMLVISAMGLRERKRDVIGRLRATHLTG